jgi:hypothetical protein
MSYILSMTQAQRKQLLSVVADSGHEKSAKWLEIIGNLNVTPDIHGETNVVMFDDVHKATGKHR